MSNYFIVIISDHTVYYINGWSKLVEMLYSTDLGSDLLDELEQAKHFPTRDAACRSVRQQLEKLSVLTRQHAELLEKYEKKLDDCIVLRQLEQQADEVSENDNVL